MSNTNVVNPGLVNVADQAQSPVATDQAVRVGPSTNPGATSQAAGYAPGAGAPNAASTVTSPMTAGTTIQGGSASEVELGVVNTTQNTVVGQQYGSGQPANVFV